MFASLVRICSWDSGQGQRTLSLCSEEDFGEEGWVPAGHAAFHDEAVLFAGMLFEQAQGETAEPISRKQVASFAVIASTQRTATVWRLSSGSLIVHLPKRWNMLPTSCRTGAVPVVLPQEILLITLLAKSAWRNGCRNQRS